MQATAEKVPGPLDDLSPTIHDQNKQSRKKLSLTYMQSKGVLTNTAEQCTPSIAAAALGHCIFHIHRFKDISPYKADV